MTLDQLRSALMALLTGLSAVLYVRPNPVLPDNPPKVERIASKVAGVVSARGWATYYAYHEGQAAAGPLLRHVLGSRWRGKTVSVCADGTCVSVRLTDWCACGPRHGDPTIIDLDSRDFATLASLGAGILKVSVTR